MYSVLFHLWSVVPKKMVWYTFYNWLYSDLYIFVSLSVHTLTVPLHRMWTAWTTVQGGDASIAGSGCPVHFCKVKSELEVNLTYRVCNWISQLICLLPCTRLNHWNLTLSSVSLYGSSPSSLLYIYTRIHGKVHYCPLRLVDPQERKEERWDWAERSGKAGAYLWLTNLRPSGLGQWNPVCLWVWSEILPFQVVLCLWVSLHVVSVVYESQ